MIRGMPTRFTLQLRPRPRCQVSGCGKRVHGAVEARALGFYVMGAPTPVKVVAACWGHLVQRVVRFDEVTGRAMDMGPVVPKDRRTRKGQWGYPTKLVILDDLAYFVEMARDPSTPTPDPTLLRTLSKMGTHPNCRCAPIPKVDK